MRTLALVLSLSAFVLTGCSGSEIVGLYIAVQPDGSAAVTARSLSESGTPSPAEVLGKGASWSKRAALVYSQGVVGKLEELRFGDDALRVLPRLDANKLTVTIERRPGVGWVKALVPDKNGRMELAKIYDPLKKTKEIGDALRLEFELPGKVVTGSDVQPTARGVSWGKEGRRAFLSIPAETAIEKGDTLTWEVNWQ
ncbi:MAG: hypothetical protein WAT39_23545 [Planctomycetota bacterium]